MNRGAPPRTTAQWIAAAIEAEQLSRAEYRRRGRVFEGSGRALRDHELRAPLKETIISTLAGTMRVRSDGERVIYGPRGEKIRVVEFTEGGNQIEHGEHLHAVVRPPTAEVTSGKAQR